MKKLLTLILLFSVFVLGACEDAAVLEGEQSGDNAGAEELDPSEITIGFSVSTMNNPFFAALNDSIVEAGEENGSTVRAVDAQDDASKQLNDVDDLIQQGIDILLINPADSSAVTPAIEAANAANIPVITIDRSSDGGEVLTHMASDNVSGGEMAGEWLLETLGEGANVIQLEGIPGASATRERGEGFMNIAEDNLNVLDSQTTNFNRAEALDVMENMLQAHSNIEGVFAQNDEIALGALEALEGAGLEDQIVIIGFDGFDDALVAIEEGRLDATIGQYPPVELGQLAVETAYGYFSGEEIEEITYTPIELITQD